MGQKRLEECGSGLWKAQLPVFRISSEFVRYHGGWLAAETEIERKVNIMFTIQRFYAVLLVWFVGWLPVTAVAHDESFERGSQLISGFTGPFFELGGEKKTRIPRTASASSSRRIGPLEEVINIF